MTRRGRSNQSAERRLGELETRGERSHAPLVVSYHPDVDEYRDGAGNVVDPEECDPLVVIATDEQQHRDRGVGESE